LVLCNGLLSMSELAVVSSRPARLKVMAAEGNKGAAGYAVTGAATGAEGLRVALGEEFDLVVLDLMLPDLSGEEIMRVLLGNRPATRIIVLSSAHEVGRRVGVLDGGAADFLGKPFANGELLARIRLRMREPGPTATAGAARITIDEDTHLDLARHELVVNGSRVSLSQREFTLLSTLAQHRGTICTRRQLLADVWGLGFDPGTNVVDVYIGRLRAKLAPSRIETVRNVGYRLAAS
jgi:DNA-binding response OmpR family regulator